MADARLTFAQLGDENATIIAKGTVDKPIVFTSNVTSPKKGDGNKGNFSIV